MKFNVSKKGGHDYCVNHTKQLTDDPDGRV